MDTGHCDVRDLFNYTLDPPQPPPPEVRGGGGKNDTNYRSKIAFLIFERIAF